MAFGVTCGVPASAATVVAKVTNQADKAVEDAVVFLERSGQSAQTAKPGTAAIMSQEDRQFMPSGKPGLVLPIQVGTTVEFPNNDPFRHQVYSFSPAKKFELPLYGRSDVAKVTFDKEGVVTLGCNIHDNMLAYIYVVATPYFGLSGSDGKATLAQLPAGSYTVKVWHPNEKTGEQVTKDLTVATSDTAEVALKIDLKRDRRQRKPGPMDEKEY